MSDRYSPEQQESPYKASITVIVRDALYKHRGKTAMETLAAAELNISVEAFNSWCHHSGINILDYRYPVPEPEPA